MRRRHPTLIVCGALAVGRDRGTSPRRRPRAPIVCGALALVLGACGGDDDAASPEVSSTTTTTGPAASDDEGLADEGIGALEGLLPALLVSVSELGDPSYVDGGYSPGAAPGPCALDVDTTIPPAALVGTNLASEPLASSVQEEIRVYESADEAAAAVSAMADASVCGSARDVAAETGADEATAFPWEGGTVIVTRIADTVLTFAAAGPALDHLEVAAFGVGKVLAALEAPSG